MKIFLKRIIYSFLQEHRDVYANQQTDKKKLSDTPFKCSLWWVDIINRNAGCGQRKDKSIFTTDVQIHFLLHWNETPRRRWKQQYFLICFTVHSFNNPYIRMDNHACPGIISFPNSETCNNCGFA